MMNALYIVLKRNPFWIGLCIRLLLAWLLPLLFDNNSAVAYTDIDYHVFMDAAEYIQKGQSPYDRHTYRYTPFLAELLSLLSSRQAGRYLFCVADAICGSLIIRLRKQSRKNKQQETSFVDCMWWMYNPLAINICTRGSAESLMVLLPVLLTVQLVVMMPAGNERMSTRVWRPLAAGVLHGIAIHSKLYPIIYTLSYMAYFAKTQRRDEIEKPTSIVSFLIVWTRRLLQPAPLLFAVTSLLTFAGLTYLAVLQYGQVALDEGLLYHLSRVDHRHNYSIFWYSIYLTRAQMTNMNVVGRLLLVPQFVLLVVSSLGLAPYDLGLALFVQTYLFVSLNKVITAQYFTWYLCLLPLCSRIDYRKARWAFVCLGLSIATVAGECVLSRNARLGSPSGCLGGVVIVPWGQYQLVASLVTIFYYL
jgi:phosphatidylinositol glycan class M